MFYDQTEVPAYRKRKRKSAPKKSNHKHKNKEFIGEMTSKYGKSYVLAEECEICGKQKIKQYFILKKVKNSNFSILLSELDDIKAEFPDLEVKEYKGE